LVHGSWALRAVGVDSAVWRGGGARGMIGG